MWDIILLWGFKELLLNNWDNALKPLVLEISFNNQTSRTRNADKGYWYYTSKVIAIPLVTRFKGNG